MLKIRQPWDRLIFNMGISILVRQPLYIETAPQSLCIFIELNVLDIFVSFLPLSPPGWRGIVVTVRAGGRLPDCGTHISVTAWRIFSIWSSVGLFMPVVVHCHGHLPISPIWACPWAKNLSNLPQIGSRLCGTQISETAGWIYSISSFVDLSGHVVVQRHSYLPICPIWACPWAKNLSNQAALGTYFAEPISLKLLAGFIPFKVLWNCLDL